MKIQIKKRYTEKIIIEGEAKSIKEFLEKNREADLWGADLWEADLRGADLRGADLRRADLRRAEINITQKEDLIKSIGIIIEEEI